MAEKQLHQGHRQRLRNRFIQDGLEHFEQHNMLELLLFYSIPQKDTNEIAHHLLNRFGTISDVLNAPVSELETVDGVGYHSALLISTVHQISDIYCRDKTERRKIVGLASITADCVSRCPHQSETEMLLVCADNTQTLLNRHVLEIPLTDIQNMDVRQMMQIVLGTNATAVVAAIHRSGGKSKPTKEDRLLARKMARALGTINVRLLDFIVICSEKDYTCMSSVPEYQLILRGVV